MKTNLSALLFFICILLLTGSCDDDPIVNDDAFNIANCCNTPPIAASVGDAKVFVPNIFTPDYDGINDVLFPFGSDIDEIEYFRLYNSAGELVYNAENFDAYDSQYWWDGKVDGVVKQAVYLCKIQVRSTDGAAEEMEGYICCLPCRSNNENPGELEYIYDCIFGTQHNGLGGYDPDLETYEELDCL